MQLTQSQRLDAMRFALQDIVKRTKVQANQTLTPYCFQGIEGVCEQLGVLSEELKEKR